MINAADRSRLPARLDLQLRYRISSHYSITGSVRNLTGAPERFVYGPANSGLMRTSRLLDRDYTVGISLND